MKKIYTKILTLAVICLALSYLFVWPFRVSGDCMEPAIKDGKLYLLNRALPYLRQYHSGDIILFAYEGKTWIARIVAKANDTVEITQDKIIINGSLVEDNIARNWAGWKWGTYAIDKQLKVPMGSVYVLSDNLSAHHDDSRVFGRYRRNLFLVLCGNLGQL